MAKQKTQIRLWMFAMSIDGTGEIWIFPAKDCPLPEEHHDGEADR